MSKDYQYKQLNKISMDTENNVPVGGDASAPVDDAQKPTEQTPESTMPKEESAVETPAA